MSQIEPAPDPWAPARPPGQDELPYSDGEPMESDEHVDEASLLSEPLRLHFADRPEVFVGRNMAVYYSMLQGGQDRFRAPDFFVVLDAIPRHERKRKSWVVWDEGRAPDLVIELLSPSTASVDRGRKKQIYAHSIRVTEYYLYDIEAAKLEAFTLVHGDYVPMVPLADGDIESAVLGLRLGVVSGPYLDSPGPWLRWKHPDGSLVLTGAERAEAERARAEAERERAEAQSARAEAQSARAEAEGARADLAEREARRLADRLRALGIDPG